MIELLNCDCMEYMATVPDKYFDLAIVDPESASVVLQAVANGAVPTQLRLELQPSGGIYSTSMQR